MKRIRRIHGFLRAFVWAAGLSVSNAALAGDANSSLFPAFALGLSNPLGVSISAGLGLMVPLGPKFEDGKPSTLAPRVDGEIGIYGELISAGVFVQLGQVGLTHVGINLRAARMKTWGGTEGSQTFNGGIFDLDWESQPPVKIGVGSFTATHPVSGSNELTYVFFGIGW